MDNLSIWVILAQIINFWIIFFIFYKFLWKNIVNIVEERRKKIESLDNSDDVVREKIEKADQEANKIIEEARSKALEIQENAEKISKKDIQHKLKEAEQKAEWIVSSAKRDIEKERLSMLDAMREKVLYLSLKINSKVFDNKDNNKEFIQKEVSSIKL